MAIEKNDNIVILTKKDFPMSNQNFHIEKSSVFPDFIGIPHKHKFIEIVYVISGSAFHTVLGKTSPAKKGDLFVINMDTPHFFDYDINATEPFCTYDLKFTPEFFDNSVTGYQALEALNNSFLFYSLLNSNKTPKPYITVSRNSVSSINGLFANIYNEFYEEKKGYIEIIRGYLMQLIVNIFRNIETTSTDNGTKMTSQAVQFVCDYINHNYANHISIQELADRVYINRDHLGRVFRKETGMTISEMIQKVRIEQVCTKLSSTSLTITDIAMSCGFDDMKFFYKVFKKQMNILPSEYRKKVGLYHKHL